MIRAIVTDIEGTTTPTAFVHDVLFPYASTHLSEFLAAHADDAEVSAILADVAAAEPGPVEATLRRWIAEDAKVTPLKALQGLIWRHGYRAGALTGALYPDVPPHLAAWSQVGVSLHVYSSGSEEAQRLLFGFSLAGDLSPLFENFFDTRVGQKREAESYRRIVTKIGQPAHEVLFLSDIEAELDAAATAGLATCQLVRPQDGTLASVRHPTAATFAAVRLALS
jgi:enolase-phosphatase E1